MLQHIILAMLYYIKTYNELHTIIYCLIHFTFKYNIIMRIVQIYTDVRLQSASDLSAEDRALILLTRGINAHNKKNGWLPICKPTYRYTARRCYCDVSLARSIVPMDKIEIETSFDNAGWYKLNWTRNSRYICLRDKMHLFDAFNIPHEKYILK